MTETLFETRDAIFCVTKETSSLSKEPYILGHKRDAQRETLSEKHDAIVVVTNGLAVCCRVLQCWVTESIQGGVQSEDALSL